MIIFFTTYIHLNLITIITTYLIDICMIFAVVDFYFYKLSVCLERDASLLESPECHSPRCRAYERRVLSDLSRPLPSWGLIKSPES